MTDYPKPWRLGRNIARTIYSDNEELILLAPDDTVSELIVDAVNHFETHVDIERADKAEIKRLRAQNAEMSLQAAKDAGLSDAIVALADEIVELDKHGSLRLMWVVDQFRSLASRRPGPYRADLDGLSTEQLAEALNIEMPEISTNKEG